jgi:hypothetical protein
MDMVPALTTEAKDILSCGDGEKTTAWRNNLLDMLTVRHRVKGGIAMVAAPNGKMRAIIGGDGSIAEVAEAIVKTEQDRCRFVYNMHACRLFMKHLSRSLSQYFTRLTLAACKPETLSTTSRVCLMLIIDDIYDWDIDGGHPVGDPAEEGYFNLGVD